MNKYNLNIVVSLMTACVVLIGLWAIQASSATTTGANNQQYQGAGNTQPDTGLKVQQGMTVPSNVKDEGGIYCKPVCVSLPDLWDMSCVPECSDKRG